MKIFVINLNKDLERLKFAQQQALTHKFSFERIEGVYASEMTIDELSKSVNHRVFQLRTGNKPELGVIGCALSHIKIYRKMISENIPYACILEDDIIVYEGFAEQLKRIENWIDSMKPIVVRLNFPVSNSETPEVAVRSHKNMSACSYCLNLAAVKALFKDNFPIKTVADDWPRWDTHGIIELYDSNPQICWHNNSASGFNSVIADINSHTSNLKKTTIFRSGIRKVYKIVGYFYDFFAYKCNN